MKIIGTGSALPKLVVTNDMLTEYFDTSDEWIRTRTGIETRRIMTDESLKDLAVAAAQRALEAAGVTAKDIDYLVCSNVNNNYVYPSLSSMVQGAIGASCPCIDIRNACAGFVYALDMAHMYLHTGRASRILVLAAEEPTRFCHWEHRETSVLFGDGAGAVILKKNVTEDENASGIMTSVIYSDASRYDDLHTIGGVSTTKTASTLFMNGKEVFKTAVHCLAEGTEAVLEKNGMKTADIDWLIPHQANSRIIDSTAKMLGINADKVIMNLAETGNTSAASIPIALAQNVQNGKIKKGDIIALTSMGAGFTWGAVLLKF